MITICIGFDPKEAIAYHVLCHSILSRASEPVCFIPINKTNIPEFTRGMEDGSTEFSFSRFLTPFLSGYTGRSIYLDCDMLVLCDIAEIFDHYNLKADVSVVKHDYIPKTRRKFRGNIQQVYPKKNWSSLMVFCNHTKACWSLKPEIVNTATGRYLHQFEWAEDVGELPKEWNHLVGECEPNPDAKIVHFTLGIPSLKGYEDQEYSDEWFKELTKVSRSC